MFYFMKIRMGCMVSQINRVFSSLLTVLRGLDGADAGMKLKFSAGEVMEALVLSKRGNTYLLQTGADKFLARSEMPLQTGERIRLAVLGQREDTILLKNLLFIEAGEPEQEEIDRTVQLIKKYGLANEKEIVQAKESIVKIPCEENTAVRYLLDPHLLAALLIPEPGRDGNYQRIEINRYKNAAARQDIWEVCLDMDMPELGRLDIAVRMAENRFYLRIWAESAHTETLLRQKKEELATVYHQVEIVPAPQGPLFSREPHRDIDLKV